MVWNNRSKTIAIKLVFLTIPLLLISPAQAAIFTVTNTADSGAGSFRQAILDANADVAPPHAINFAIAGGPHVITLLSALPPVNRRTAIDASAEAIGAVPGVRISGAGLLSGNGLNFAVAASQSSVSWLAITQFPGHGLNISSTFTIITNCYIGISTDGVTDLGNGLAGVQIQAENVSIGTNTTTGNLISGNTQQGILVQAGSDSSKIYGNKIGTNAAGTAAVPNSGVGILGNGSSGVFIGTGIIPNTGNLISGNGNNGINLGGSTSGWFISANRIGTTADGSSALPNSYGIRVFGDGHFIGSNLAAGRNLISGNTNYGIEVFSGADNNSIYGNDIGLNFAGTASLGTQPVGIRTVGTINGLVIGGDGSTGYRNVISGHTGNGILIEAGTSNAVITGNYIGLNAAGTAAVANGGAGVNLGGTSNTLGSSTPAFRNVISGNAQGGVILQGSSNTIKGNYIGTNAAGGTAIGNVGIGIRAITVSSATIGGTSASDGNVISGNTFVGVALDGDTSGIAIKANLIGLNAAGTAAIPNGETGISLSGNNHTVGGTTAGERNVISGNAGNGLVLRGDGNIVRGNYIGTNTAGTSAVANESSGIRVITATNATIGGTSAAAANVISGNSSTGISLDSDTSSISIKGNIVGLNPAGMSSIPNSGSGIRLDGNNNIVGGGAAGDRNVISGNAQGGVVLTGTGNLVQGNYIGTAINGSDDWGNSSYGVRIYAATNGELGGDTVAKGNVIAGNERGVSLELGTTGTVLRNNIIGLNATMTAKMTNNGSGIELYESGNTIGMPGAGNVIAGANYSGISIGDEASSNIIQGNWIGTNKSLAVGLGNGSQGIFVASASDNTIGGTDAGEGNIIAYNGFMGVQVERGDNNQITGNSIFSNVLLGIDLGEQYVFPNDLADEDIVGNRQQNYPLLSSVVVSAPNTQFEGRLYNEPNTQYTVEFFSSPNCDETGMGEGKTYRGSAIVNTDANGEGTISTTLNLTLADAFASATVTDPLGNTSEFSPCAQVGGENPGKLQFFRSVTLAYEGNLPTGQVIITRSHGLSGTITANFTISNGTATAGSDYTDVDQVVTFQPWEVVKVIEVPILVDPAVEPDPEEALLALANPTGGATLGLAASELLIFDQDKNWPGITIDDVSLTEGNAGQTLMSFNVTLTATNHPVSVDFQVEPGTAVEVSDYAPATGLLEFGISDDPQTLQASVQILGDTEIELDEYFWMRITGSGDGSDWIAYDTYGLGVIVNDDGNEPPPEDLFKDGFED